MRSIREGDRIGGNRETAVAHVEERGILAGARAEEDTRVPGGQRFEHAGQLVGRQLAGGQHGRGCIVRHQDTYRFSYR